MLRTFIVWALYLVLLWSFVISQWYLVDNTVLFLVTCACYFILYTIVNLTEAAFAETVHRSINSIKEFDRELVDLAKNLRSLRERICQLRLTLSSTTGQQGLLTRLEIKRDRRIKRDMRTLGLKEKKKRLLMKEIRAVQKLRSAMAAEKQPLFVDSLTTSSVALDIIFISILYLQLDERGGVPNEYIVFSPILDFVVRLFEFDASRTALFVIMLSTIPLLYIGKMWARRIGNGLPNSAVRRLYIIGAISAWLFGTISKSVTWLDEIVKRAGTALAQR